MAKRRRFTSEFKAEVVLEALRGESSQSVSPRAISIINPKAVRLKTSSERK